MFNFILQATQLSIKSPTDVCFSLDECKKQTCPLMGSYWTDVAPGLSKNALCKGHILLLCSDVANKTANNRPCEPCTN